MTNKACCAWVTEGVKWGLWTQEEKRLEATSSLSFGWSALSTELFQHLEGAPWRGQAAWRALLLSGRHAFTDLLTSRKCWGMTCLGVNRKCVGSLGSIGGLFVSQCCDALHSFSSLRREPAWQRRKETVPPLHFYKLERDDPHKQDRKCKTHQARRLTVEVDFSLSRIAVLQ